MFLFTTSAPPWSRMRNAVVLSIRAPPIFLLMVRSAARRVLNHEASH